jgi:dihydrofolate synthase/folylpolyglutamate synthase
MTNTLDQKLKKLFSLTTRGIKPGLARIQQLLDFLGHPETDYPIIHVAGTNGKGSTCRIMHSILTEAGFKTGLYTSPHLLKFNERIKINNREISDDELLNLFAKFDNYLDAFGASFFEITTAMALDYFRQQQVDIVVLEVGLGGRFDATNAVLPNLSVITSISKDHEEYLGNTIEKIAAEKGGIIKENVPVVIGPQPYEKSKIILQNIAKNNNSKYFSVADTCNIQINKLSLAGINLDLQIFHQFFKNINYPLPGLHQVDNLSTALSALSIFPKPVLNEKLINNSLKKLKNPGRFELISENPVIIYDVAHNSHGIQKTIDTAREIFQNKEIDVLIAFKSTKNLDDLGKMLKQLKGNVYISEMEKTESKNRAEIFTALKKHIDDQRIKQHSNINDFLQRITNDRKKPLLILGSHYMAESIYKFKNFS